MGEYVWDTPTRFEAWAKRGYTLYHCEYDWRTGQWGRWERS